MWERDWKNPWENAPSSKRYFFIIGQRMSISWPKAYIRKKQTRKVNVSQKSSYYCAFLLTRPERGRVSLWNPEPRKLWKVWEKSGKGRIKKWKETAMILWTEWVARELMLYLITKHIMNVGYALMRRSFADVGLWLALEREYTIQPPVNFRASHLFQFRVTKKRKKKKRAGEKVKKKMLPNQSL